MELSISQRILIIVAAAVLAAAVGGWIGGILLGVFLGALIGYATFSALLHEQVRTYLQYAPTIERVQHIYETFEDVL